jgi:hypothetical protein
MAFALRCPECRKSFRQDPSEPWPRYCPMCSADMGEEKDDNVICLPAFLSAGSRANDQVYRDIEQKSEFRAQQAAELAGVPVADMSGLKITDLNPTIHAGAVAAPVVSNEVTRHMEMINARGGNLGWQGSNAVEYSGAVQSGPHPNVGAKMRSMIQQKNGMVSDRPAIETTQPGYRVRG